MPVHCPAASHQLQQNNARFDEWKGEIDIMESHIQKYETLNESREADLDRLQKLVKINEIRKQKAAL